LKGTLKLLYNIESDSAFKQATYSYLATAVMSKEEKAKLEKIFKAIDKNGDGTLTKEELE